MLEEGLISEASVKELLKSTGQSHPERRAALLEYQNAHFGDERQTDDLVLTDNDPEFKRRMRMAERREQIKNQEGIRGIVFVATGGLERFGQYDEYTNAHDFKDLKEFIEKRGGFLRSSVSSKTDYLICNDPDSNSIKSKKAKELGVPVISEEEFLKMAKKGK